MPRAALEPGGAESLRHPQMTYVDRDSDPAFSRPRTGLEGPGVPGRARGTRHSWKMRQHCCLPLLVGVLFLGFYLETGNKETVPISNTRKIFKNHFI